MGPSLSLLPLQGVLLVSGLAEAAGKWELEPGRGFASLPCSRPRCWEDRIEALNLLAIYEA